VMSELPGWYVFDDLYTSRAAKRAGVFDQPMTSTALDEILHFLGWQIRARKWHGLYAIPKVEEGEIDPMNAALKSLFKGFDADWLDLQEEWLIRLATRQECTHWGYKAPGAFRYLDKVLDHHPRMKAVFLLRAPEAVLASYKYMPKDSEDGDPAQYHPISHAIYWRMAARAYQRAIKTHGPDRINLVRFEDMVVDPGATITRLAEFLATNAPEAPRLPLQKNTSFPDGKRRELNGLEQLLVSAIAGRERAQLGFPAPPSVPRVKAGDVLDFCATSGRALGFRAKQAGNGARRRLLRKT